VVRWDDGPEDSVSSLLSMAKQLDVRAAAQKFDSVEGINLVSCRR
jgi:hypothetical protein